MKILLLNSPWINNENEYSIKSGTRWAAIRKRDRSLPYFPFPYTLASSAAYLRKKGFEAHIKDAIAEEMTEKHCLDYVESYNPTLLVIEAFTPSIYTDLDFARKVRDNSDCWIALCGVHPSAMPEDMLKNNFIDFILLKEYDWQLNELCSFMSKNFSDFSQINGIAYKKNGFVKINPEKPKLIHLDEIPFPDRDELPIKNYTEPLSKYHPNARVVTTRGCPFNCTFCVEPFMCDRNYRKRSINLILEEIEILKTKYGIKEIYFDDALFTIARGIEIAEGLLEHNIKIAWNCWIDPRITPETLKLFQESGCTALKFAVESSNPNILNNIGKKRLVNMSKIKELVSECSHLGILSHASFMFGAPGETRESIQETLDLAFSSGFNSAQFSITTPLPGTKFYDDALKNRWLTTKNWREFETQFSCVVEYPNCTKEDILNGIEEARKRKVKQFICNPMISIGYIWKLFRFLGIKRFILDIFNKLKFTINYTRG